MSDKFAALAEKLVQKLEWFGPKRLSSADLMEIIDVLRAVDKEAYERGRKAAGKL